MKNRKVRFLSLILVSFAGTTITPIYAARAVPNDWYATQVDRDTDSQTAPSYEWLCKYKNEKSKIFSALRPTQASSKYLALEKCKDAASKVCKFQSCVRLCANCREE